MDTLRERFAGEAIEAFRRRDLCELVELDFSPARRRVLVIEPRLEARRPGVIYCDERDTCEGERHPVEGPKGGPDGKLPLRKEIAAPHLAEGERAEGE